MEKELKIFIVGQSGTGKTTVMTLINEFLKVKGFDVEIVEGNHGEPLEEVKYGMNMVTSDQINAISRSVKIKMSEEQAIAQPTSLKTTYNGNSTIEDRISKLEEKTSHL